MFQNCYELLGVEIDADQEAIRQAYDSRIATCESELMKEKYSTAYYKLIDGERRYRYDLMLGIHRYKRVSLARRVIRLVIRCLLSMLDAVMTFYWCFLVVLAVYVFGMEYYRIKSIDILDIMFRYSNEIYILFLFAVLDLVLHFYVRRLNRYLKNDRWELKSYSAYRKYKKKRRT